MGSCAPQGRDPHQLAKRPPRGPPRSMSAPKRKKEHNQIVLLPVYDLEKVKNTKKTAATTQSTVRDTIVTQNNTSHSPRLRKGLGSCRSLDHHQISLTDSIVIEPAQEPLKDNREAKAKKKSAQQSESKCKQRKLEEEHIKREKELESNKRRKMQGLSMTESIYIDI